MHLHLPLHLRRSVFLSLVRPAIASSHGLVCNVFACVLLSRMA
jgi:hypothetical protein